jgi:hypothetical protein
MSRCPRPMGFPRRSLVIAACQLGSAGSLLAKQRRHGRSIATLRHLAAVQAKLAFRLVPAMRRSVVLRLLPRGRAARRSGVVFPHRGPCRDQTGAIPEARRKLIATRRPIRKRFDPCARGTRGGTDRISLFMALLSLRGISHPAPASSRRATPLPPRAAGDLTA